MLHLLNLAFLLVPHSTPAGNAPTILAAVPDDATAIAYCQDFAGLRERALRNDWFKLMRSEGGEPLLGEMEQEFRMQTRTQMSDLYAMAGLIQEESVLFMADDCAAFLTTPPPVREGLTSAMLEWLPATGIEGVRTQVQVGVARVELAAWPTTGDAAWEKRIGHYAAFLDHPDALGLFSANSLESLMASLTAAVDRIGSDHRGPLVKGLEAARGSATPTGGIEFYIDYSSTLAEAEAMLAEAGGDEFPDPSGMLGLEQDTWLHVKADIFPGRRVDCQAFLNIPRETLAARLADTFRPLPADMPGRLPNGLWGLYALQWDIAQFYETARAAFIETHGEQSVEVVDAGLMAAESMTGVDPLKDVVGLLDGTFALYFAKHEVGAEDSSPEFDDMRDFGLFAGLKNGDLFLDAFEQLVGVGGLDTVLDLEEIEGFDVFTFSERDEQGQELADEFDGGLAFLPHALVLSAGRSTLLRNLRAMKGVAGSSALDDETILGAFNDNTGVCFLACVALKPLQQQHLAGLRGAAPAAGEAPTDPFDSLLISSARRTPDGFRFQLTNR